MSHQAYVWENEQVRIIDEWAISTGEVEQLNLADKLLFDPGWERDISAGKFISDHGYGYKWVNIPITDFPPEFRLQLLLLGVS